MSRATSNCKRRENNQARAQHLWLTTDLSAEEIGEKLGGLHQATIQQYIKPIRKPGEKPRFKPPSRDRLRLYTDARRKEALKLKRQGVSTNEIARRQKVSPGTVWKDIQIAEGRAKPQKKRRQPGRQSPRTVTVWECNNPRAEGKRGIVGFDHSLSASYNADLLGWGYGV